jgi:hypothetical protein
MGLMLAALLGSTPALAAENTWDSYIAAQLSPNRVVAKTAAGTINRHARDITMTLVQARKHWNELSPETQALAGRWMARPDVGGGDNIGYGIVYINPAHEAPAATVATGNFRIHYVRCATYPSDANCALDSYINAVKAALEKVYTKEIDNLTYTAPPGDGADGGGAANAYDVYVAEIGSMGIYGYASPESSATVSPSYLVIDNDYADFGYSDPTVPMKVTVAHEYFHSVQFGYDSNENSAFMENSSTWMETQVYPTIHDNYQYLGEPYKDANGNGQYDRGELFTDRNGNRTRDEGSLDYPEAPLDTFNDKLLQYGRWLWPQHLTEEYGAGLMKDIWDLCAASAGENHLTAMNTALINAGVVSGLAGVYQNYAIKGYDTLQFSDGANYPRVWVDGVANGKANLKSSTTYSLGGGTQGHLSTVYERINNPNDTYSFTSAGGTAALSIIEVDSSCGLNDTNVSLSSGDGTWSPTPGTAFAIAVISNVSSTANDMSWSLTGGTSDTASVPACGIAVKNGIRESTDSGGGGGGGALDLLALSIAGLLYARRRLG